MELRYYDGWACTVVTCLGNREPNSLWKSFLKVGETAASEEEDSQVNQWIIILCWTQVKKKPRC